MRLSSSAAAGFNLSWDEQDTATCGYTVEWCTLGNAVPCTLQWMKVPEGNNTLFLPAGKFLFCYFPLVVTVNASAKFPVLFFIVTQEISKQVVDTHLISTDAQKMDTDYWRDRPDTHKSSVSYY